MVTHSQGIFTKSMSSISSSGSAIKALAGSHPVIFGSILGIGAYYAISKYWLNKDDTDEVAVEPSAEAVEEMTVETEST